MRTSIYLSNRSIAAVSGEVKGSELVVSRFARAPLPWGLVINGAIADADALTPHIEGFLRELGSLAGKVSLVIDGDSMTGKVLDVPALAPGKMRELIRAELTLEQAEEFVHDYSVISQSTEGGGGRVFALAAERAQIEAFTELFAGQNIMLRGIDVTQSCAMRFFSRAQEYGDMSFIAALASGADIVSMLFCDGEFSFIDRSQLAEQRGTPAAAVEISRVLSSMVQYAYARSGKNPLKHAFISGLEGEEAQFYGEIGDALGISVAPLLETCAVSYTAQKPDDWSPFLFCLGDLMG